MNGNTYVASTAARPMSGVRAISKLKTSRLRRRGRRMVAIVRSLVFAIVVLTFLNPLFLHLQNPEASYTAFGFGSFLGPLMILLSIRRIQATVVRHPQLWLLVFFPICLLPGAVHSDVGLREVLSFLILWTGYAGIALAVAAWTDHVDFAKTIFWAAAPTIAILTGLSLLKYYSHLPIPYLNELAGYLTYVEMADATVVRGLLGPFLDRTQAAMLLEGIAAFILGYVGWTDSTRERAVGVISLVTVFVFMMHSTNRSFFLTMGLTVLVLLSSIRWSTRRALRRWLPILAVFVVAMLLAAWQFRQQFVFYANKMIAPWLAGDLTESGVIRFALWSSAAKSWSILGWGPLGIPVPGEILDPSDVLGYRADPHSNYVFFFWRGGVFGVLWIVLFGLAAFRILKRAWPTAARVKALMCFMPVLASMFIGGVAHTSLPSQLLWVFVGVFLGSTYSAGLSSTWRAARVSLPGHQRPSSRIAATGP